MAAMLCPSCRSPLPVPAAGCPSCGLPLTGSAAAELWQVDQQLEALRARRTALVEQLQASRPAVPGRSPSSTPPPSPPRRPWAAQQVLLGLGALLLLVAAAVFVAVAWSALGVAGQVAVMAAVTAATAAGSVLLARRGLRASAETFALLAVGLAVVDAVAAHRLDLAGLRSANPLTYAAGVAAAAALVLLVLTSPRFRVGLVAYRVALGAAAASVPLLAVLAAGPPVLVVTAVFMSAAAGFEVAARWAPSGWSWVRRPSSATAGLYLLLGWLAAAYGTDGEPVLGAGGACAALGLAAAVVAGWLAGLRHGPRPALTARPLLTLGAGLAGPLLLVLLVGGGGPRPLAVLTALAVAVVVASAGTAARLATSAAGTAAALGALVAAAALGFTSVLADLAVRGPDWAALTASLAVATLGAAVVRFRRPSLRVPASLAAAAGGSATTGLLALSPDSAVTGYALLGAGIAAAVAAARSRHGAVEVAVGSVAVTTAGVATIFAAVSGVGPLAVVLGLAGVTLLAYGLRLGRGWVGVVGAPVATAARWVLLVDADSGLVEAYTLPLAGLIGLVGLVRWRRLPRSSSWLTEGPALSAALLPSAVVTLGDPDLLRPLVVLAAGALVLVAGVVLRRQAPVLIGALACAVVAVGQLAPYAVGLPRWLSFGALGLVLLVLGARYEARRRNADQAVRWLGALR